jgi:O-antigen/teichoic acid export membrane protein
MAKDELKAGALLSYLTIILSNVIGLLYTPFMLRMLGQSEFGLYSLVSSIVAYLTILDFGFGNALIRYTARFQAQGKQAEQYELFGMFLIIYSGIGLIAFVSGLCLYFNVDRLFGESMTVNELDKARIMMVLLILNLTVTFPLSIFGSIITAYENFIFQKLINLIRIIIYPCIMIPMLLMGYKAISMVVVITALNILSLLINFWYCFARLKVKVYFKKLNINLLKEIFGYSFLVFLGIIVDRIYWSTGQFILGIVAGTTAIAVFALAIQLNNYYMSFSTAISGVFLPRITSMITRNSPDKEVSDVFIRTGRIQFIIVGFILSGFVIFGKSFIDLWAGKEYESTYAITLILIIPFTVPLIQNLGISILQARNQLKFRSYLYVIVAILSLLISIPLAKVYQGIGCAIGTSFAMILGNIIAINIYYYRKINLDIPRFWREIFVMSYPMIIMTMIGLLLNQIYTSNNNAISLGIKIILFTGIYIPVFWKFGMNDYEHGLFRQLIKSVKMRISSHN